MKRRSFQLALLVLAGAIVNVAVAWGFVYSGRHVQAVQGSKPTATELRAIMAQQRAIDWAGFAPDPDLASRTLTTGVESISCTGAQGEMQVLARTATSQPGLRPEARDAMAAYAELNRASIMQRPPVIRCTNCGWPCYAFRGFETARTTQLDLRQCLGECGGFIVYGGFLPAIPIWPGFAINTVFYAVILWMLFALSFNARRCFRVRRGLCPACAYPVGQSPVCTECGGPVP